MLLVVKGDLDTALAAAKKHGVTVVSTEERTERSTFGETSLQVDDGCEVAVVKWYCEPPRSSPYPPGTLLYYAHRPTPTAQHEHRRPT